jgi:hypothetical protein
MRRVFTDPDQEIRFRRDGYVVLDLLSEDDVAHLLRTYERFEEHHEGEFTTSVLMDDLGARREVHDRVGEVLGARLLPVLDGYRLAVASYAVKRAGSGQGRVPLHQDFTFVDERTGTALSLWCPLVEVGLENGCLGVVPGSHPLNDNYREPCFLPYPDLVGLIEEEYLTPLPMRPGQAVFMDSRLFHGSPGNRSPRTRVVAAGVAVPRESQLLYCHRDLDGDGSVLEVYEVPADFYLRHDIGSRPAEGRLTVTVPRRVAELTELQLRSHFAVLERDENRTINPRP